MGKVIDVGGRFFGLPTDATVRQDGWMIVQCADAGMMDLRGIDESNATAFIVQILRRGMFGKLLAGVLVEIGQTWTPQFAEKNAEYFESVSDPVAKRALWEALIPCLLDFFDRALPSSPPSPSVSGTMEHAPEAENGAQPSTANEVAAVGIL